MKRATRSGVNSVSGEEQRDCEGVFRGIARV